METPKAGVSAQLREIKKKENQAGIGTVSISGSALISCSNKTAFSRISKSM